MSDVRDLVREVVGVLEGPGDGVADGGGYGDLPLWPVVGDPHAKIADCQQGALGFHADAAAGGKTAA
jgi:hypothetical protein